VICSVFKPSRKKDGKRVRRRLWWGQYRLDGDADITRVPLRTADKQVAKRRLDEIVRTLQQERAGLIASRPMRDAASTAIEQHIDLFTENIEALGRSEHYVKVTRVRLCRLARECGWNRLSDISSQSFQKWRAAQKHAAKTVNDYLAAARGLIKWLILQDMLRVDPLEHVKKVSTAGKKVRKRRAFTADEVARLLEAAPIERRRFYMAGYYTGLRRSELEALQWGDLDLSASPPRIKVRPDTTKNSKEAIIAIHPELLSELLSRTRVARHTRHQVKPYLVSLDVTPHGHIPM